jgi:ribosome-binding protein aMBF1 (putative translation factor)
MAEIRLLVEWMAERGVGLTDLIAKTGLDDGVVAAIAQGRYTPSPEQRRRLSDALGIEPEQVAWGHVAPIEHVYGHGPQFGRSP